MFEGLTKRSAPRSKLRQELEAVNKELWLVLSLVVIAWLLNSMVTSQQMLLGFYTLPTVASAYMYGRRHATLTAFASVLLVVYLQIQNPGVLGGRRARISRGSRGSTSGRGAEPS